MNFHTDRRSLLKAGVAALYAAKQSWRDAWAGVEVAVTSAEQVEPAVQAFLASPQASASGAG